MATLESRRPNVVRDCYPGFAAFAFEPSSLTGCQLNVRWDCRSWLLPLLRCSRGRTTVLGRTHRRHRRHRFTVHRCCEARWYLLTYQHPEKPYQGDERWCW
jgi:hypothetical protein